MARKNRYVEEHRQQEREKAEREWQSRWGRAQRGMWESFVGDWTWPGGVPEMPPGYMLTQNWDGSPKRSKYPEDA